MQADFLKELNWTKVALHFEAAEPVELPPFCGPTLRGALGHTFRPALCDQQPHCRDACAAPASCRYYALFERNRAGIGNGRNIPKPMILSAPIPDELESVILGGRVRAPYRSGPPLGGEAIPPLWNDHAYVLSAGARIALRITFLGEAAAAMVPIIEFLGRNALRCGRGHLKLRQALDDDASGRVLFDSRCPELPVQAPRVQQFVSPASEGPTTARRVRVVFRTPTLLKLGNATCFDPGRVAKALPEHCMIRAVQIYNALFARPGYSLPWMTMPDLGVQVVGQRLFHYVLPRLSHRQGRWMRFDGLVGYLDLAGDLTPAMPFLRAAEILHFGQKATFGLGEVKCFVTES
jgi:CRISPR-associated endoribonuclease Cas6